MANMPSSGTLWFSQLRDIFGTHANPQVWMSWYYRGAGLVPDNAINYSVPTGGTIWMHQFYGTTNIQGVFPTTNPTFVDLYRSNNGNLATSVGVAATGGTGSYSWSYGWASGGQGITLTGNDFNFSVSANGTYGQYRGGVVRCTVVSGPFSSYVDVNVNMTWGQL